LARLRFKLRASHLQNRRSIISAKSPVHFFYFGDGVLQTICPCSPQTLIFPSWPPNSSWDYKCEPSTPNYHLFLFLSKYFWDKYNWFRV
jgi:hypothetical protein